MRPAESELQARRSSHFRPIGQTTTAKIGCLAAGGLSAAELLHSTGHKQTDEQTRLRQQPKGVRGLLPQGVHWGLSDGRLPLADRE